MISIDYSVFPQIIAFLIFWFAFSKLLVKPYLQILAERERKTEGARTEAAELVQEAEQLRVEYDKAIAEATAEAQAIKDSIRAEAARARDQILQQARHQQAEHLQRARETVRQELERARAEAARSAEAIASDVVAKILGRRVA